MKDALIFLLAFISACSLVEIFNLPINRYLLYAIFFFFLILLEMYRGNTKRWNKISFNDAISDEIMRLRSDLTELKIKHDKSGWDSFPDEFLKMERMYYQYPYIGFCDTYKNSKGEWGKIIVDLSDDDWFDDDYDNIFSRGFNSETIRKIKSPKMRFLKKGMSLVVHIHEGEIVKDFGDPFGSCCGKSAKIIAIHKGKYVGDITLTLEINLRSKSDFMHFCSSLDNEEELIEESKIIRKVKIYDYFRHGLRIEDLDNSNKGMFSQLKRILAWADKNPYKAVIISEILILAFVYDPMAPFVLFVIGYISAEIIKALCKKLNLPMFNQHNF